MSKQTINIGASPNDGTGTPLRTSFDYTNQNFTEIYTALGGGVALPGATTQVIFNDGGTNLAGDAGLVYNKTTDALTVAGLVTAGSATITGDLTVDTSTLKVDSTNNRVGIGTATPSVPLYVTGNNATATAIMQDETNGAKLRLLANSINFDITNGGGGGEIAVSGANPLTFKINSSEQMRLNSTGLGVGGIVTGTGPTILVEGTAGTYAKFNSKVGAKTWSAGYRSGTTQFEIQEDGTERFVIANGGNVGIGVTPSAWAAGFKVLQFGPGSALSCNTNASRCDVSANYFYDGANKFITATGYATSLTQENGNFYFYRSTATSGGAGSALAFTQAMTLDASGNLLVGVVSANANGGVLQLKSGITFPATQVAASDANTLDDYEEGTWTPSLGGVGVVYATQTGQYTKIGNLVFIKAVLVITTIGTGSTTNISGLPFTNKSGGTAGCSISSFFQSASSVVSFFASIANNGTTIAVSSLTAAGTTEAANPIFQGSTQFQFTACYNV